MVRGGKIDNRSGGRFNLGITVKFGALIRGHRQEWQSGLSYQGNDFLTGRLTVRWGSLPISTQPVARSIKVTMKVSAARAHHVIVFPVACFTSCLDVCRSFVDHVFALPSAEPLVTVRNYSELENLRQTILDHVDITNGIASACN